MKNVAIWIRVSTEDQAKGESPEHHEVRARHYAESKGWTIRTVYHLEGLSGKSIMDYPETKRMLKDIHSGEITGLIFSKLARLGRNIKELLEIAEIFRKENADLISLQESIDTSTPAGRLFYANLAAMAQFEREETSDRVASAVYTRAQLGKPTAGQAPYGYKWIVTEDRKRAFVIDEKEGPIRKLMYELFAQHKRKKRVADLLNQQGFRTRNGSKFSDTTVDRLLRDSCAIGQRVCNYSTKIGAGKSWKLKDKKDWFMHPCPALIPEDLWHECNKILDDQRTKRIKIGPRIKHLMAGFVYCTCGKKMYVFHATTNGYFCQQCKRRIAVEDLEEIYQSQLKSFLLSDSDISVYLTQSDEAITEKQALYSVIQKEHAQLKKQTDELVSMRVTGEIPKEHFMQYFTPQKEKLDQLERRIPEIQAEIDFLKIQQLNSGMVIQEAQNLYESWPSLDFEAKRNIIELITEKIIVGAEDIEITLSYSPSANPVKSQQNGRAPSYPETGPPRVCGRID